IAEVVSDEPTIELEQFERIEAAPDRALLRVAARPDARRAGNGPPTLVIDDGARLHRLAPLPAPADPTGLMRAAYSAPVALLQGRTACALELGGGAVVDLPAPTRRARRAAWRETQNGAPFAPPATRGELESDLVEERKLRDEAERRAEARRHAITELE